jgi:ureidoacrylate peracid hydrolase
VEEALGRGRPGQPALNACLLLFDFLVGHVARDPERYAPVIANAASLLSAARAAGAMVAHARADHRPGSHAETLRDTGPRAPLIMGGTPEAEIVPELAPRPGEHLVPKLRWSAFHGTDLDRTLRGRRVDTIVLCGGSTEIGIASTAYAARDLDYNLVIVADACTSAKQDVHEQLMREVFPRLARVRNTMRVLEMIKP